ncbi:MAG: hypothetical protein WCA81_04290 [Rhizomicrobium sp.]
MTFVWRENHQKAATAGTENFAAVGAGINGSLTGLRLRSVTEDLEIAWSKSADCFRQTPPLLL